MAEIARMEWTFPSLVVMEKKNAEKKGAGKKERPRKLMTFPD